MALRRQAQALLPRLSALAQKQAAPAVAQAWSQQLLRSFADDANLKKTALYDLHVAHGGELNFCSQPAAC